MITVTKKAKVAELFLILLYNKVEECRTIIVFYSKKKFIANIMYIF